MLGYDVTVGWNDRYDGYCFYHSDEQNSTTYITGTEGGIKNHYQYDAFGSIRDYQEKLPNRILYTGQQYDFITKQYYLRARYYSPTVGRFLQEDVYRGDGLDLYAYCRNNPVIYYDPSGYYNKDGAKGKQSTVDLNDAIGRIGEYCDWTVTHGALGKTEEYFPGPQGGRTGSHRTDVTMKKEIDGQTVTVRVNTTTDASGNIPDTRERKNAYELDGQIKAENVKRGEVDSLNQIVTISKTDGKINNVDYTNTTQRTDPFNQNFQNPNVANEMKNLQNELNNLGTERAAGKTSAQIAAEYEQKTKDKKRKEQELAQEQEQGGGCKEQ